jgi:AcrR family transcriptional regulator
VEHEELVGTDQPPLGLRERKKAKTRAAIQHHALRLFREQGYDATTVEQIAEAAEISPSTFFRYFPTKEEVVFYDDLDPLLIEAFEAQPPELTPIQALRGALRVVFTRLPAKEMEQQMERGRLMLAVPELRMRMLDQLAGGLQLMTDLLKQRLGPDVDEFGVRTLAGAMLGALMSGVLAGAGNPHADYMSLMDTSLAYLEAGLPV